MQSNGELRVELCPVDVNATIGCSMRCAVCGIKYSTKLFCQPMAGIGQILLLINHTPSGVVAHHQTTHCDRVGRYTRHAASNQTIAMKRSTYERLLKRLLLPFNCQPYLAALERIYGCVETTSHIT